LRADGTVSGVRSEPEVRAAGGVVTQERDGGVAVMVVHRPRYDDWSLPKGKLEPGETLEACAQREVLEETGFVVALGDAIGTVDYVDRKGRPKRVHYWEMSVIDGEFAANDEVDEIRWLSPSDAIELLSYERDADFLRQVMERRDGK
jgi:8-oxo-dGTP diphosphatase